MKNRHGEDTVTRVVEHFEVADLGAPFKVVLANSITATFDGDGNMLSYDIPDFGGLERAVAIARLTTSRKLKGAEIKFLRRVLSIKQQELANGCELSVEHLSKVENGHNVLSPGSEKLARIFMVQIAVKLGKLKSPELRERLSQALDRIFEGLVPIAACDADDELVFTFERGKRKSHGANDNHGVWDDGPIAVGE